MSDSPYILEMGSICFFFLDGSIFSVFDKVLDLMRTIQLKIYTDFFQIFKLTFVSKNLIF